MPAGWVAAGAAVLGAAASYAGSKKQADASTKGAGQQMAMFNTLNQQQQPYIQSGYGAMGKLNTLLGIGGGSGGYGGAPSAPSNPGAYRPTPSGGMQQQIPAANDNFGAPPNAPNLPLKHILALRAQNGDTEAQRVLQGMV